MLIQKDLSRKETRYAMVIGAFSYFMNFEVTVNQFTERVDLSRQGNIIKF